jgi:hypothetical protein
MAHSWQAGARDEVSKVSRDDPSPQARDAGADQELCDPSGSRTARHAGRRASNDPRARMHESGSGGVTGQAGLRSSRWTWADECGSMRSGPPCPLTWPFTSRTPCPNGSGSGPNCACAAWSPSTRTEPGGITCLVRRPLVPDNGRRAKGAVVTLRACESVRLLLPPERSVRLRGGDALPRVAGRTVSMTNGDSYTLLFGPYQTPACRVEVVLGEVNPQSDRRHER